MKKFIISTDNNADLPDDYIKSNDLPIISLSYMIDGQTYDKDNELPYNVFYDKMRKGSMPTTSQINPEIAKEKFKEIINEEDADILHIAFSSGLSGSYNSACIAAEELAEEYGNHKITVIDSLSASLGQGLLVYKAIQLKNQGKSMEEIEKWLEENKLHLCHYFTVDDLNHLYRGGRVSKATAFIGTVINVKPILHVDNEGHLISIGKVRGRKRSLIALVENMEKQMGSFKDKNDIVFISHGDCEDEAEYVASLVKERFGIDSFIINYVGPTIGAHSGPGTMALFFMGENR